jgi:hypothetical protein
MFFIPISRGSKWTGIDPVKWHGMSGNIHVTVTLALHESEKLLLKELASQ